MLSYAPSPATPTSHAAVAISPQHRSSDRIWLLLLLLVGFALRLFHLGSGSLWYDETVSAYLAAQPLPELIAHTARDIHPPAYYLLLHGWKLLANPSVAFGLEFLYAWPSLCLAMAILPLTYALARRYFGTVAARWALAFALLQPFQVWSAQEVRMYALGACCLMLTLWAVSSLLLAPTQRHSRITLPPRMAALYLISALLGLYTLYYFLFWLVVLNVAIILRIGREWRALRSWLLLQLLILLGWLPWLPIFVRQALTPPVPAWRLPWQSSAEVAKALNEGFASFLVAHTPPFEINWPWALIGLLVCIVFLVYTKSISLRLRITWLWLSLGPLALLLLVSLIGPSIYHVRYLATYTPLFALLVGAPLAHARWPHASLTFLLLGVIACLSLNQLWTNPRYAADDHRSAVATLARQWRPGDAIIVNAGWVYTAIALYWPTELPSPATSRPPAIAGMPRITEQAALPSSTTTAPLVYRTGSVEGPSSLGWGLPESDFFAISQDATTSALAQLAASHATLWHYRLYDTVSDPGALIRTWLNDRTTQDYSQTFPGPGFLLLESYRTSTEAILTEATSADITYPDAGLHLNALSHAATLPAGETLYVTLEWQTMGITAPSQTPALSLRLYDAHNQFLLQSDTPVIANPTGSSTQSLALPIPAGTMPGDYTLSLVVYAPDTLAPYTALAADSSPLPSPTPLGQLSIRIPATVPHTQMPQATFDYIDLVQAEAPATPLAPGSSFTTNWTWRPRPSSYTDHYTAHLQLTTGTKGGQAQPVATWDFVLGSENYPSSQWPAAYPLIQRVDHTLPPSLAPGIYQLQLSLTRTSDGKTIPARLPWRPWQQPSINISQLEITSGE
ncbi:MAG: hypothetical protein IT328_16255 [Caldilineaceae bacterium]|nr:hypothetical protein [Caldilineaceae bacterium]